MINEKDIKPFTPPLPFQTKRGVHNYMSTPYIYGLIRHLCKKTGGPYLEIGSYRGMGLVAAAKGNPKIKAHGIDNFTGVGYRQENESILLEQTKPYQNVKFTKADYQSELKKRRTKYKVIFIDGPHNYKDSLNQLELSDKLLQNGGYMIVDDINFQGVKTAFYDFFDRHGNYKLVFEKNTGGRDDPKWWNGVAVLQKVKQENQELKHEEQ